MVVLLFESTFDSSVKAKFQLLLAIPMHMGLDTLLAFWLHLGVRRPGAALALITRDR